MKWGPNMSLIILLFSRIIGKRIGEFMSSLEKNAHHHLTSYFCGIFTNKKKTIGCNSSPLCGRAIPSWRAGQLSRLNNLVLPSFLSYKHFITGNFTSRSSTKKTTSISNVICTACRWKSNYFNIWPAPASAPSGRQKVLWARAPWLSAVTSYQESLETPRRTSVLSKRTGFLSPT